jgi:hypothetical protein
MRFSYFLAFIISLLYCTFAFSSVNQYQNDTCKPSFKDIYNFEVGNVFQYCEKSSTSAGGSIPTSEIRYQFTIREKIATENSVKYHIQGWKKSMFYYNSSYDASQSLDTTITEEFIDEYLQYVDSALHFLNMCPKDVVPIDYESIKEVGLHSVFTRIQTFTSDTHMVKTVGGQNNVLQYNEKDSLIPVNDVFYKAEYRAGLGLVNLEFSFLEKRERIFLEAYCVNNDSVGDFVSGEYPALSATSIRPLKTESDFDMYPNPAKEAVYFNSDEITYIEIVNLAGQRVIEKNYPGRKVNIAQLKPGIYLTRIKLDGTWRLKKLVKK